VRIGFLLFPDLTQLDLTGPFEVLARSRHAEMFLVWKSRDPVQSACGLSILPTATFADCPQLDLICVPGGSSVNALLTDTETLDFVRRQSAGAQYVTSVCTGALVLGAAGLLHGRRATTHWTALEFLAAFGAIPCDERVVVDGNVITAGGVTAGIDFGLRVLAEIDGEPRARGIQLALQYDPQPPFNSGHPRVAGPALVEQVRAHMEAFDPERRAQVERAAISPKRPAL
jgi:cyclohexyl-isocyanide hydratase